MPTVVSPKFVYNPGSGNVTLTPTLAPILKAGVDAAGADEYAVARHDTITISGLRQVVTERVDTYRTLNFDWVPDADITAWSAFMLFAIKGGTFAYYPDATSGTNISCTLDDTNWSPKWNLRTMKKFTLKLRMPPQ